MLFRVSIRSSCGLRCGDGSPIRPMLLSSSVSLCGHVCVLRVGGVYDVLRKWPGSMRPCMRRDFRRWIFSLYDERDEGVQFEMKLKAGGKARARATVVRHPPHPSGIAGQVASPPSSAHPPTQPHL